MTDPRSTWLTLMVGRGMINTGAGPGNAIVVTGLELLASIGARVEVSHGDRVRFAPVGAISGTDLWGTVIGRSELRVLTDDGRVERIDEFGLCPAGRWARASELH